MFEVFCNRILGSLGRICYLNKYLTTLKISVFKMLKMAAQFHKPMMVISGSHARHFIFIILSIVNFI